MVAFLLPILQYWRAVVAIILMLAIALMIFAMHEQNLQITSLAQQNLVLQANLEEAKQQARLAQAAQDELSRRLASSAVTTKQLDAITKETLDAPASDDASVAPILRGTLDELERMRHSTTTR